MLDEPLLLSTLPWRTEQLCGAKEVVTRVGEGTYHRCTYADLGRRVRRLAGALAGLGVGEECRVDRWDR